MIEPIGNVPPSYSLGGNQSLKGQLNTKLVNLQIAINNNDPRQIKAQSQELLTFISENKGLLDKGNLTSFFTHFQTTLQDTVSANSQDVHDDAMQAGKAGYALYQQIPS